MSLRTRLILSYVLIIVICLGIAGVSLSVVLQNYRDRVAMTQLDAMTRPIYVQVRDLLRGQTTLLDVWTSVQQQAQDNNAYILFIDDRGNLLRQASPVPSAQTLSAPDGFPHGISQPAHGIFTTSTGQKFIYSAYPLGKAMDMLLPRTQTLVLCQPRGTVATILAGIINPFIWAGVIALLASMILAIFMARSVYRPIQSLSKAAGDIAQGKYDEAIPVTGTGEIKGLALSFNEMAARVKESQQHLRHFVADVSHQLKSPLTSIQGFAQAMLDGTASDEATRQKATRIIVDESKRMIKQVNELLELSRMQAGQVKMSREAVDVREMLLRCQEIFALRLEEKKISVQNQIGPLPVITGDADRIEDVFSNLLDNAIKNTPLQGEIQIAGHSLEDKAVEVTISDSGPGIPPEQIPHVFERFQQSGGMRSGFGLGLAIAREIVLAHRGEIKVSSSPGEGATFSVTLPV